jgi:hypothetical protein
MITPTELYDLYLNKKKSVAQIAVFFNCSQNKINYWLEKYEIPKRTISDALYELKNPNGDPFSLTHPQTLEEGILFGMGLALYWGEGTKRGSGGMRLTNSDPKLIRKFIEFSEKFLNIDRKRLKFSIQIPQDVLASKSLKYWMKELDFPKENFYKPLVVKVRGKGTYKYKTSYGTVIVNFNNIKLKKLICGLIENIQ